MYLIVGLGNPEQDYANTRHNMGFNVVNKLAEKYKIDITKKGYKGLYGSGIINNKKVILLKPQTFMNLSGESIIEIKNFYKIDIDDILIIYDDIDTEVGKIRIRKKGSAGTHNGVKSVIQCLGTIEFARIRVGIGAPKADEDLIEYVIGAIKSEDVKPLEDGVNTAVEAVEEILENGIDIAMNKFN